MQSSSFSTFLFYIDFFYNFRSRTVETTTYACENNGETETRVEQKVTIQSDGEPIDHDEVIFNKNKLSTKIIIKTSPKGFSASKCDVGNWIFSKS